MPCQYKIEIKKLNITNQKYKKLMNKVREKEQVMLQEKMRILQKLTNINATIVHINQIGKHTIRTIRKSTIKEKENETCI